MQTKLHIDLTQGIIEVEGDEKLIRDVYGDFREKLSIISSKAKMLKNLNISKIGRQKKKRITKGRVLRKAKEKMSIVQDLDLSEKGDRPSLKDFYSKFDVKKHFEKNLIFVYYLQERAKTENITTDHVFTCYKEVKQRVPTALKQSLIDTSHHKGWIDTSHLESITVTTQGSNYIEHDMKKKEDK